MKLLVIDTSTDRPAVGLATGNGRSWAADLAATRKHGRDLVPAIRDLLEAAGLKARELEVIGIGIGPGSYTGLRIGLTAAKVLAYASGAALVAFDSLVGAAENAPSDALRVHAVADAQRGDVYAAELVRDVAGSPLIPILPSRVEALKSWSDKLTGPAAVVGPGLASAVIRSAVPSGMILQEPELYGPRPEKLIDLVGRLWSAGRRDDLWTLEPNYLRRSAAEDQWDARGRS
jgi:tRNA threonylcarbamoyladenosine biosynthesis protein TsaB